MNKAGIAFLVFCGIVTGICATGWADSAMDNKVLGDKVITLNEELEQQELIIPLEDRFANLMDALSDENGVMKYDVDINAELFSDAAPDTVSITLHLKEGQAVK